MPNSMASMDKIRSQPVATANVMASLANPAVVNKRSRLQATLSWDLCNRDQLAAALWGSDPSDSIDLDLLGESKDPKKVLHHVGMAKEGSISFKYGTLVRSVSFPLEGWERPGSKVVVRISKISKGSASASISVLNSSSSSSSSSRAKEKVTPFLSREQKQVCDRQVLLSDESKEEKQHSGLLGPQSTIEGVSNSVNLSPQSAFPRPPNKSAIIADILPQDGPLKVDKQGESQQETKLKSNSLIASDTSTSEPALDILEGSTDRAGPATIVETCPPTGKSLQCGRRPQMEDTVSIVPSFIRIPCGNMGQCCCNDVLKAQSLSDLHFFGVYDGHGGAQVSDYCMKRLHTGLSEELMKTSASSSEGSSSRGWEKAMTDCFLKMDIEVGGVCPTGECNDTASITCSRCVERIAPENVGSTAVVAVLSPCQIVVGNSGDSRAVLSRSGKAIALSRDHKPEREDERNRIEAAGGHVIYWDGYRVGALLALSRAIGDRYLKEYVVAEPEVTCTKRTEEDEFLILATDGLWDVMSNDTACDAARKCLASHRRRCESASGGSFISASGDDIPATATANYLSRLALSKNSKDNISIVVVDLKARQR